MRPRISSAIVRNLMTAADMAGDQEICGLLRGRDDHVRQVVPTANVAERPGVSFEIDPAALIAAYRLERRRGALGVRGCYHSHPNGRTEPSPRDAAAAAPDGRLWLIVTGDAARMWRAVSQGEVHGRFDPVAFDVTTGKRVLRSVAGLVMPDADKPWSLRFEYFRD